MGVPDILSLDDGYYAAPDPDNPDVITCWRRQSRGRCGAFAPWQCGVRYGPAAHVHKADVPAKRSEREAFVRRLNDDQAAWLDRVYMAILAGPAAARELFASFTTRCYICGRTLTDARSKLFGIGPDCRGER